MTTRMWRETPGELRHCGRRRAVRLHRGAGRVGPQGARRPGFRLAGRLLSRRTRPRGRGAPVHALRHPVQRQHPRRLSGGGLSGGVPVGDERGVHARGGGGLSVHRPRSAARFEPPPVRHPGGLAEPPLRGPVAHRRHEHHHGRRDRELPARAAHGDGSRRLGALGRRRPLRRRGARARGRHPRLRAARRTAGGGVDRLPPGGAPRGGADRPPRRDRPDRGRPLRGHPLDPRTRAGQGAEAGRVGSGRVGQYGAARRVRGRGLSARHPADLRRPLHALAAPLAVGDGVSAVSDDPARLFRRDPRPAPPGSRASPPIRCSRPWCAGGPRSRPGCSASR